MKFILSILLLANVATAQTVGKQAEHNSVLGVSYESNLVINPSAYKNDQNKTVSSATATRDTTSTNQIDSKASWLVDASALNGFAEWTLLTPSSEQTSGNCGFSGIFKGDGTLYKAQILDGSSNVLAQTVTLTNETGWREFKVWHPCGASGARKVRITQTEAGTAPAINVGRLFYGRMEPGAGTSPNTFSAQVSPTGVVSLENEDFINGNCVVTDTSIFTCTFNSSKFNLTPSCSATMDSTFTDALSEIVINSSSSSSYSFRTGFNNTSTSFTKAPYGFKLICTRSGSDYVQPAITPQNYNFGSTFYTSTVSNLGAGSATVSATYSRQGSNATVCISATKDGSGGSGSGTVSFTYPPGVVIDTTKTAATGSVIGVGYTSINNNNFSLVASASGLVFFNGNNDFIGSAFTASQTIRGCVTFPVVGWTETQGAPQLVGSVIADTAIKADKSAGVTSVDYGSANGTLTAGTNISSVTSSAPCQSMRVGNTVHALCSITFTCTTASGTLSNVLLAPPIPTTQGSTIRGTFSTIVPTPEQGWVNNSGNSAFVVLRCGSTLADTRTVSFMYQVP